MGQLVSNGGNLPVLPGIPYLDVPERAQGAQKVSQKASYGGPLVPKVHPQGVRNAPRRGGGLSTGFQWRQLARSTGYTLFGCQHGAPRQPTGWHLSVNDRKYYTNIISILYYTNIILILN